MTDESYETLQAPQGSFGAVVGLLLAIAASVAVAQVALSPQSNILFEVRFCNLTPAVLSSVVTYGWRLGDIAPGRCSAFVRMNHGFSTMGFGATSQARRYDVWPEDHVGDQVLAEGRYTFLIEATQDGLTSVVMNE